MPCVRKATGRSELRGRQVEIIITKVAVRVCAALQLYRAASVSSQSAYTVMLDGEREKTTHKLFEIAIYTAVAGLHVAGFVQARIEARIEAGARGVVARDDDALI